MNELALRKAHSERHNVNQLDKRKIEKALESHFCTKKKQINMNSSTNK